MMDGNKEYEMTDNRVAVKESQDKTIGELAREVERAQTELDKALEKAVKAGRSFSDLAMALGQTEAAIRLKAKRNGWYVAGTRRSPALRRRLEEGTL